MTMAKTVKIITIKENLGVFLYYLLRDYITVGQLEMIMETVSSLKTVRKDRLQFSNEKLGEYVEEIVKRLLRDWENEKKTS